MNVIEYHIPAIPRSRLDQGSKYTLLTSFPCVAGKPFVSITVAHSSPPYTGARNSPQQTSVTTASLSRSWRDATFRVGPVNEMITIPDRRDQPLLGYTSLYLYHHISQKWSPTHPTFSSTAWLPISYTLKHRWDVVITRFDFKSETSFGFLSQNYTARGMWLEFSCKTSKRSRLASFCIFHFFVIKRFLSSINFLRSKPMF